jgi:hypothetical protein
LGLVLLTDIEGGWGGDHNPAVGGSVTKQLGCRQSGGRGRRWGSQIGKFRVDAAWWAADAGSATRAVDAGGATRVSRPSEAVAAAGGGGW